MGDVVLTPAQDRALKWLSDHGGDAAFDRYGVALAMGQGAPVTRSTWNALRDLGKVEFYNPSGKGRGRLRLVRQ
ncbi:MAG: hypothetical protein ACK47C_07845 [Paracoccaceae bacterium]